MSATLKIQKGEIYIELGIVTEENVEYVRDLLSYFLEVMLPKHSHKTVSEESPSEEEEKKK